MRGFISPILMWTIRLQHPDDDAYYLNHNLDGTAGYTGGIYTEPTYNNTDFMDRMTVVYGHNMRDDKRFSSLHRLEDNDVGYAIITSGPGHMHLTSTVAIRQTLEKIRK